VDAPSAVASARSKGKDNQALARTLAANGIWYDAIGLYSELIDARPNDRGLREERAALLDQVGLKDVANYDRQAAK
jgi:Flp pilus assembly protein TadD